MHGIEKAKLLRPFFNRLSARDSLSELEMQVLVAAGDEVRTISAKTDFIREGDHPTYSTLILEGIAARCTMVEDGGRQITAFQIAGDFVDLHSFIVKHMDHGLTAMTDLKVMTFPHDRLRAIMDDNAHLSRLLWLTTLLDNAIHRQWLVAMGRMQAVAHISHLFCEQFIRAREAGLVLGTTFPFPVTQADLSDALGISAVHTNRILRDLRRDDLVAWDGKTLQILNWNELQRVGMFDPSYLHLDNAAV
jgi:CRP-like cAMP-binding protein